MESNPFPLQLRLRRSLNPQNENEEKNRNDVRRLRESEERSARQNMREGYRHDNDALEDRMSRHKKEILQEVQEMIARQKQKIHREEAAEESSSDYEHEKDHGMDRHERRVLRLIENLRNKEGKEATQDLRHNQREDERRAVRGMRENQRKDEDQIVRITREVANKKACPKCGQYPCVCGESHERR